MSMWRPEGGIWLAWPWSSCGEEEAHVPVDSLMLI